MRRPETCAAASSGARGADAESAAGTATTAQMTTVTNERTAWISARPAHGRRAKARRRIAADGHDRGPARPGGRHGGVEARALRREARARGRALQHDLGPRERA